MITEILQAVYSFLHFLIGLFPVGNGFPSEVHSAFTSLGGYVGLIDAFAPISVMLWCLTFIFGVEIAMFGFKTLKWLLSFIPIIGGKGNQ
jgi:hypothetical protein